jgi:predicted transcriptional regulator
MKQVYIVQDGRGNKKIGITSDINRRVMQLKTAMPNGIMFVMTSDFMENAREIEKQLHEANKDYRLNGEWFSDVVDLCGIDFAYDTIEILDGALMLSQEKLSEIASNGELTAQGYRVLFSIIAQTDFDNCIRVKQVQIAKELGMNAQNVSKAFKQLVELNIIEKINHDNINGYRLNYEMGWKGKASNLKTHMKDKRREETNKIVQMAKHAKKAEKATDAK